MAETVDSVLTPASVVVGDSEVIEAGVLTGTKANITEENCLRIKGPDSDMKIFTEANSYVSHVLILSSKETTSGE